MGDETHVVISAGCDLLQPGIALRSPRFPRGFDGATPGVDQKTLVVGLLVAPRIGHCLIWREPYPEHLFAKAEELFARPPQIEQCSILASKG